MEPKKLYRSHTDKKISGICGGIAAYFAIDPNLVRLAWIIFGCMGGAGVIAYLVAFFFIPEEPRG